jgi:outer membrane protein assembly factor BamB
MTPPSLPVLPRAGAAALALALLLSRAVAGDWPTYMHDRQRSGVTSESLGTNLAPAWVYPRVKPPVAAWADEAKKDFYVAVSSQKPFKTRLVFDHVNHVVIAGGRLFAGSATEHTIRCFGATTGEPKWTFFTDAPVRMAPAFDSGRVYAGSDDGAVYCLDAANGGLLWKYTASGTNNYLVPNNGHFASPWAVRTGVAVESGVAYFAAGIFPHDGMYLCAVDAATGARTATNHWQTFHLNQGSFQGYVLLSPTRVFVPGARSNPFYFDRRTGAMLGQYSDANALGTFTLLSSNSLFWGPSSRGGAQITEGDLGGANLTTLSGANALVATTNRLFYVTDTDVRALNRSTRAVVWTKTQPYPNALILAGSLLIAGGDNEVAAFDATAGAKLWSAPVQGRALGLAVANGLLYVSTDQGFIHAFASPPSPPSSLILF